MSVPPFERTTFTCYTILLGHIQYYGAIELENIFFYYRDIIYNLYQDMCTYSQLKKIK